MDGRRGANTCDRQNYRCDAETPCCEVGIEVAVWSANLEA